MENIAKVYAEQIYTSEKIQLWKDAREILKKVITGELTRYDCREGLCDLLPINLTAKEINKDFEYWSGQRGYVLYSGKTTESGRINEEYLDQAIAEYNQENRFCRGEVDDTNPEYWEARKSLACHWVKFVELVLSNIVSLEKNDA
ncbi:hypothetical protein AsFcp4_201 [Aeromonas phage AsFcp_4]|nr:hypothetical protein AsFcp4_201 [Aeromonas phage AsFcp_4]